MPSLSKIILDQTTGAPRDDAEMAGSMTISRRNTTEPSTRARPHEAAIREWTRQARRRRRPFAARRPSPERVAVLLGTQPVMSHNFSGSRVGGA
jgi:hypothetical protein